MKNFSLVALITLLTGCVAGAPPLTPQQQTNLAKIQVFKVGETPSFKFQELSQIKAADCSGPSGTRLYGDEGKAMDVLLAKAASVDANAIVNVSCGSAPYVNNCWVAKMCKGTAVVEK
ncbi:hypothetical protein EAG18_10920 [Pseudoalteromonas sp. J010]|uniref:hypothetical protein n=1 Tax=Pseudoalteromonas sp. J010 TaxID=998465 RepID=UPI000F647344|nr:hypothetical protein [Pseudoalteromonas sp. J010]RRS08699.1 hypothetical protein EAG18_10920 [Pseudoalteromonas sp. J010]